MKLSSFLAQHANPVFHAGTLPKGTMSLKSICSISVTCSRSGIWSQFHTNITQLSALTVATKSQAQECDPLSPYGWVDLLRFYFETDYSHLRNIQKCLFLDSRNMSSMY